MNPEAVAAGLYSERFGAAAEVLVRAPGRVNLIGEHTDYNDGFVLPCAIDYHIAIAGGPRGDGRVRLVSANFDGQESTFDLDRSIERDPLAPWSDYVRGVAVSLLHRGHDLRGADLVIAGNVPLGAGLSSSAALEMVAGAAFARLGDLDVDGKTLALVGQEAENSFVGCSCGIMDQYVSMLGQADHALLIDCRTLEARSVPMPTGTSLVIVNSNVRRGLVDSEYNVRRAQCEAAAAHFGVRALRDLDLARLETGGGDLDPLVFRRARHVVTENQRTLDAAEALAEGDLVRVGELMASSHTSMRDDFEITIPAIDDLVEIIDAVIDGRGGVRMTGGGFGGCVVALAAQGMVGQIRSAVEARYPETSGLEPTIYVCRASQGAAAALPR